MSKSPDKMPQLLKVCLKVRIGTGSHRQPIFSWNWWLNFLKAISEISDSNKVPKLEDPTLFYKMAIDINFSGEAESLL
jgi:hypothetical protein